MLSIHAQLFICFSLVCYLCELNNNDFCKDVSKQQHTPLISTNCEARKNDL